MTHTGLHSTGTQVVLTGSGPLHLQLALCQMCLLESLLGLLPSPLCPKCPPSNPPACRLLSQSVAPTPSPTSCPFTWAEQVRLGLRLYSAFTSCSSMEFCHRPPPVSHLPQPQPRPQLREHQLLDTWPGHALVSPGTPPSGHLLMG